MLMHCCGSMDVAERLRDQVAGNANSVRGLSALPICYRAKLCDTN